MSIYLIRHGKTRANEEHRYCGSTDLPLSEGGRAELNALTYRLPEGLRFVTSGMLRTEQTLQALFGDVPHSQDPRFRCMLQQEVYDENCFWCELMPAQASKAQGVLRLKELLGCDRVVCFGDGLNDLPLFALSDESYAVQNAVEELKSAATGIIPSNREDGVAHFLEEQVLSR